MKKSSFSKSAICSNKTLFTNKLNVCRWFVCHELLRYHPSLLWCIVCYLNGLCVISRRQRCRVNRLPRSRGNVSASTTIKITFRRKGILSYTATDPIHPLPQNCFRFLILAYIITRSAPCTIVAAILMGSLPVDRLVQVIEPELETVGHREDRLPWKWWGPHHHTSGLVRGGLRNKLLM